MTVQLVLQVQQDRQEQMVQMELMVIPARLVQRVLQALRDFLAMMVLMELRVQLEQQARRVYQETMEHKVSQEPLERLVLRDLRVTPAIRVRRVLLA